MDSVRWQQIKSVLGEALDHPVGEARAAYLAEACRDDTGLRREIDSLLATSPERLERVADDMLVRRSDSEEEQAGRRIGAYILTRELGRGGMGAVYLASRADEQFQKQVAIKLLKRGTDTDEVLRRFRAEREILARLEHPNIALLLDGGTTDDGLPYFIMEYVAGTPVTAYCVERNLSLEERLRLFLKVCAAVRFAHQNLVIHRDLKPANILITDDCEPKLLDFGIAKLVETTEGAFALTIAENQRLTPAYASPEQVRGDRITTVSDVYALGALLYEMLTGKNAHRFSTVHPAPTELLRVVAEQMPLRPSAVADNSAMVRRLRGDLDTIVLRALAKEPARRYGGVGALAEDVERYLEKRPVHARKDTLGYRTVKLVQRNKLAVTAVAAVVAAVLVGIVGTLLAAREARIQRALAERRFDDVRRVANSLMLELHSAIKDLPGALAARQLVTTRALEYLDALAQEAGDNLALKSELATAYEKIGLVTFDVGQALGSHRKAVALNEQVVEASPQRVDFRRQLSASYSNLSDVLKISGDSTAATEVARKALRIAEALSANDSSNEIRTELVKRYLSLDAALSDAGHLAEALEAGRKAAQLQEQISSATPDDMQAKRDLAEAYGVLSDNLEDSGDVAEALAYADKSATLTREVWQSDPTSARSRRNIWENSYRQARQSALAGNQDVALAAALEAVRLMEELSQADPADTGHRYWLAATYLQLGNIEANAGKKREALEHLQKAIALNEELFGRDPDRVEVRRDLTRMYQALGLLQESEGDLKRAAESLQHAGLLAQASATRDPQNWRVTERRALIACQLGHIEEKMASHRHDRGHLQSARSAFAQSVQWWTALSHQTSLGKEDSARWEDARVELAKIDAELARP